MSEKFVKKRKQLNIYQPYAPVDGVCKGNDPSFIRLSSDLVSEDEVVCYTLEPSTCPDLAGALVDVKWGEDAPNVECTYSLDQIKSNEQILEYVKIYGKDLYFQEVIMPKIFKFITNQCPTGVNGVHHSTCLKILENSEVGKLCKEWAKTHRTQADLIMKEYASRSTSSDCDCLHRSKDPYYQNIATHHQMKKVTAGDWYAPCRNPDRYLITSDITASGNKVNKRVSAAANYGLHRSKFPRKYHDRLNQFSDVPIVWDVRAKNIIANDKIEAVDVPTINEVRAVVQESDQTVVVPGEAGVEEEELEPSLNTSDVLTNLTTTNQRFGNRRYRLAHNTDKSFWYFIIPIGVIFFIVIIIVIAIVAYRNRTATRTVVEREEF